MHLAPPRVLEGPASCDGIVTLSVGGEQNLLPIWHDIGRDAVMAHSPSLADKFARSTADTDIDVIAAEIADLVIEERKRELSERS